MKEASFAAFVSVICILLSSCTPIPIAIPLFPEERFQVEELQFLKPGETTRDQIRDHLWEEPRAIRNNGKLLLYTKSRNTWFVWAGTSFGAVDDVTFLFIEMSDDDILYRYEVVREYDGCTTWGLCLDEDMYRDLSDPLNSTREAPLVDDTIILLEQRVDNLDLNHAPDGQCPIITYLNKSWPLKTARVQIDESPKRAISKNGYLKNIVTSGKHILTVHWPLSWERVEMKRSIQKFDFNCEENNSFFVSVYTSGGIIRMEKINIEIESADEGLKSIKDRHLIIN